MIGLINRSIQLFVTYAYGAEAWARVALAAGLDFTEFEAMMQYDDSHTPRLLDAAAQVLEQSRDEVMEDIGTFIVSHHGFEGVRRLLRFGGIDFVDFLHSLDDLDERVRLAVPDLHLPKLELMPHRDGGFSLLCDASITGYGNVMMGLLRAMADDYGALVLLEHTGTHRGKEIVSIRVIESDYSEGRRFELGACTA
ncbi:heme NO-binding domain-containing protein [Marimonas sp. MJW-29]|uniref:Heme NO-binding domain-containing protein n=1 Tax=Sulfitobacter sediminis TaxID=3234186 RepID=A0ABV3RJ98_9RHOB